MISILEALTFNSLYGLIASVIAACIMYKTIKKYNYVINILIYMVSRTLFGFIISKILIAITKSERNIKLTLVEFIYNLIIGAILAFVMKKLYSKGYKKIGLLVIFAIVIEAILTLSLSLIITLFV